LALFFQIALRLSLPLSAHSGPFAFELLPFALLQIGFVLSSRYIEEQPVFVLILPFCLFTSIFSILNSQL
jgi:hypothetical protein